MRLPLTAMLFTLALVLAGCSQDSTKNDKKKKDDPASKGQGRHSQQSSAPVAIAGVGTPTQQVAQQLIVDLRKPEAINLDRVSTSFLKVIGKPLSPLPDDQAKKYNATEAANWLHRAASSLGGDARISPPTGLSRGAVAVFVGTFESATAPKGRYLIRLVDEGGKWKLDWFEAGTATTGDLAAGADPFQDFSAEAAADLIANGPLDVLDRAPLAAALLSSRARASLDVNQTVDSMGYDYKRGILATRLDSFLGAKANSYTRAAAPSGGAYKFEFTLTNGTKKIIEIKLVPGESPDTWIVDEIK